MERCLLMHKRNTQTFTRLVLGVAHYLNQLIDSIVINPVRTSCKEAARQAFLFIFSSQINHRKLDWSINLVI